MDHASLQIHVKPANGIPMPTENRSSITEMVSVPRQLTREMLNGVCMHPDLARSLWAALLKNAPQPANLHQGEPVGEVVAFGKGLHEIAWAAGRMPKLGAKLYTHPAPADPGEVEQLSQIIHDLNDERDQLGAEAGRLRAQLAERDALLRDVHGAMREYEQGCDQFPPFHHNQLMERIDAALPASAEPSAPAGQLQAHDCGGVWPVKDFVEAGGCPKCGPDAPVERDERAEFEQACREAAAARGRELDPEALRRRTDGSHVNPLTECGWWGWQARAALGRNPS